jgi:alanine racemase
MEEALELVSLGGGKPIQILSFFELNEKKIIQLVKHQTVFPLYTLEQAEFLNSIGIKIGQKITVHLKVDVGTSRVGVLPNELKDFIKKISVLKNIFLEGLWSHFSSSEESKPATFLQLKKFRQAYDILKEEGIVIPIRHIACTASTVLYPETHFEAVRVGLGTYGLHPSLKTEKKLSLKPALSLNTKIIQVKKISKGTAVSYGGTWIAKKDTVVATLPIGYFDGIDRKLSNKTFVLVKGVKCPQIGRVCMNLTMVDVTKVKNPKMGDIVTIIGEQNRSRITVEKIAKTMGTINYEVVARINPLIPRIII